MRGYRAGTQFPAGLGLSTVLPDFDFETYSEAGYVYRQDQEKWISIGPSGKSGIGAVGAFVYAEHPSTEILSLAYDLKQGEGPKLWVPGDPPPQDLFNHIARGGVLEAFNSMFEYLIWNIVGVQKLGWPELPLWVLRCAAAKAKAFSYPGSLEKAGNAAGVPLKDAAKGKQVIKRYSIPRNPTKNDKRLRIRPSEEFRGLDLYTYNDQDIVAEAALSAKCPDLSPEELDTWMLDQKINLRGLQIDVPMVDKLIQVVDVAMDRNNTLMNDLTGGQVCRTSEAQKTLQWLHGQGVHLDNLEEETLQEAHESLPDGREKDVVKLRMSSSAASIKKLYTMRRCTSFDGRYRGLFQYYRAITGRFSSEGLQTQNMKSSGPDMRHCDGCNGYYPEDKYWCPVCGEKDLKETGDPLEWNWSIAERCIEMLKVCPSPDKAYHWFGYDLLAIIGACMRGMITAAPGKELLCSDYTAIEAVVLAALAGEEWRLDVFRTHGKIYEKTASDISSIPMEELLEHKRRTGSHHPYRKQLGKIPELASGFNGWIGAWKNFGADKYMTDEDIKDSILKWRKASPMIEEMWGAQWRKHPNKWEFEWDPYGLEGMAVMAVLNPGVPHTYRLITYLCRDDALYCFLPSGRYLTYHQPRLDEVMDRRSKNLQYQLSHMAYNTNPSKGRVGWVRVTTWAGTLTENVTQAVARDILCHGKKNVERAGYPVVLHVHDEIASEVPIGYGSIEEFEALMGDLPHWCKDWPVKAAGGWRGQRYRKD